MHPSSTKITIRAQGRWREILPALGVDGRLLTNKGTECPVCGGKDRFRFDDKEGRGTWFCNQSHNTETTNSSGSAGNGFALIMDMKRCDFAEAARLVETVIGTDGAPASAPRSEEAKPSAAETYAEVRALWKAAEPIALINPAGAYLKSRIGHRVESRALRYHPQVPRGKRKAPAMLSAYVDVHGDLCGLQRTFLTMEGTKTMGGDPRLTMGTLPEGGAVRLARHEHILGIAEGVETALAATALYRVPCWAALNAGRLKVWEPPEGVREVIIFGDNDLKNVGQAAAYALGERLNRTITAQVLIPPDPDTDWNDVLKVKLISNAA